MTAGKTAQLGATQVIHLRAASSCADLSGDHIAGFDWRQTPLGAAAQWSPSLRVAVDIMLLSPFPCALVWGPDLTLIPNLSYISLMSSGDQSLGTRFDQLWHDQWSRIGPWVFQALEGRANFIDTPLQLGAGPDGPAWFAFGYAPLRDEQGAVAGFLHTAINTTASMDQVRQWREQAQGFERQMGEYLPSSDHLWHMARDAMVVVDRQLALLAANAAWRRVLGWDVQSMDTVALVDLVHPADRAEVRLAITDLLQGREVHEVESRLKHKDGHYCWICWSARPQGDVLVAVGRDITEERLHIVREAQGLLRDNQRMEIVGQLAGGMAHEMNNLLAGVGGSLELLQRRMSQGRLERIDEYVHVARDSVQRAMALTHRLLAFARSQPLQPCPADINRLLLELQPLILQALGPDFELHWLLDVAPWPIHVDAAQLEIAILHLCNNARDAAHERGVVNIRTSNERLPAQTVHGENIPAGDYVAILVEDKGTGMPAQVLARAFEPFFTTKPKGRGAGLGLAMVYGFVRQSGGHVWVESNAQDGTIVTLLFARHHGELPATESSSAPAEVKRGAGERILLIDDQLNLRALMREVLTDTGFVVSEAGDAVEAMAIYEQSGPFDLVISDIGLPGGMSGRQLGRAIRQQRQTQRMLFITGYTEQPLERSLLDQPGTALMLKPFSLQSLVDKVLGMLDV